MAIHVELSKASKRNTEFYSVQINGLTLWFSYSTVVAFRDHTTNLQTVCSENVWSVTTGRHLNELSGKKDRVERKEFEKWLETTLQKYNFTSEG